MTTRQLYDRAASSPSDIWEHVPILYKYASAVFHVTEFGSSRGNSTAALLMAGPQHLVSYDIERHPNISEIEEAAVADGVLFRFVEADVRTVEIELTDLLFIDTWHADQQIRCELQHAEKVNRYLIFHDTETYGLSGEGVSTGIWPAISRFLRGTDQWVIDAVYLNNNGLVILRRVRPSGKT